MTVNHSDVAERVESNTEIRLVQSQSTGDESAEYTIVCKADVVDRCLLNQIESSEPLVVEQIAADPDESFKNLEGILGPDIPTCVVFYAIHDTGSHR